MNTPGTPLGKCPICRRPVETDSKPFCSPRCAEIDLGRWFNGAYVVPTHEAPGTDGATDGVDPDDANG